MKRSWAKGTGTRMGRYLFLPGLVFLFIESASLATLFAIEFGSTAVVLITLE